MHFPVIPTAIVAYYTNLSILSAMEKMKLSYNSKKLANFFPANRLHHIIIEYFQKIQFYASLIANLLDGFASYH